MFAEFLNLSYHFLPVGPLCLSKHNGQDRRLDDNFPSFKKFNRTLVQTCEPGKVISSFGQIPLLTYQTNDERWLVDFKFVLRVLKAEVKIFNYFLPFVRRGRRHFSNKSELIMAWPGLLSLVHARKHGMEDSRGRFLHKKQRDRTWTIVSHLNRDCVFPSTIKLDVRHEKVFTGPNICLCA